MSDNNKVTKITTLEPEEKIPEMEQTPVTLRDINIDFQMNASARQLEEEEP